MTDRYRVTHVAHYIGGRLVFPDRGDESIVTLPDGTKPGRWLQPLGEVSRPAVTQTVAEAAGDYEAKHIGGGRWAVVDQDGNQVSALIGKDEAKAEATRLNAGGSVDLAETDPGNLPDA